MPTLSDKLKALGVNIGISEHFTQQPRQDYKIEHVVPGRILETTAGAAYIVDQFYSPDYIHSPKAYNAHLTLQAPREAIAQWAGEPQVAQDDSTCFGFLDTETSGLSGGTGTYAFLVGVGKFESGQFHLSQFFMRDPSEEPALLMALEAYLAPCTILVTFNGKAFDVPLLNTRYLLQGWISPLADMVQVDLLHLARRLWHDRLPSRTLGNLEYQILGTIRSSQEVPGWMIPQLYFDYLRSGDARSMQNVFYHNAMDVLSLATLLDHCAHLLHAPQAVRGGEEFEQVAMGRIYEDLGNFDLAIQLFQDSLEKKLPDELYWDTLRRLSFIYKRLNLKTQAFELWEKAAHNGHLYAHVEMAKILEHERHDFRQALFWTKRAQEIVQTSSLLPYEQKQWLEELDHRIQRLQSKDKKLSLHSSPDVNDEK